MTISVSTQDLQNQIDRVAQTVQRLNNILASVERLFNTLTSVSWLSPAGRAMAAVTRSKMENFRRMIRAWEAQGVMLTNALNLIRQAEDQVTDKAVGLPTNAFTN